MIEKEFLKAFKRHSKIAVKRQIFTKKEMAKNIFYGLCPFRTGDTVQAFFINKFLKGTGNQYYIWTDCTTFYLFVKQEVIDVKVRQKMIDIVEEIKVHWWDRIFEKGGL